MPEQNTMMFVRPINCRSCEHGYYGLKHARDYAMQKGYDAVDIEKTEANKGPVYDAIDQYDPLGFYGFGHGNSCVYTGDAEEPIFTCSECGKLKDRVVYLLSCLTANGLGSAIIHAGGQQYAGFNISWTWMATGGGATGDPYDDKYAYGFYESANELWMAVIDGLPFHKAVQKSIDKYNEWIDYWYNEGASDPYSQDAIKWLAHDRDGLVHLNRCLIHETQSECLADGCYWWDNSCHTYPKTAENNLLALVPMVSFLGLGIVIAREKTPDLRRWRPYE